MSFLSTSIASFANSLDAYSTDGAVLQPDAVVSIVQFLRDAASDAAKLERMLERRLTTAHLPQSAPAAPAIAGNVVPFPVKPAAPARPTVISGGDVA